MHEAERQELLERIKRLLVRNGQLQDQYNDLELKFVNTTAQLNYERDVNRALRLELEINEVNRNIDLFRRNLEEQQDRKDRLKNEREVVAARLTGSGYKEPSFSIPTELTQKLSRAGTPAPEAPVEPAAPDPEG